MADEPKVVTQQVQQEVVLPPGSNTSNALGGIFDKIESGKAEGKTSGDVIREERAQEKKEAQKPEVKEKQAAPTTTDPLLEKKTEEKKTEKPEGSLRDSLREATAEKKVETPAAKVEGEEEISDAELQVLPTDKPKTVKRIQALLKKVDEVSARETSTKSEYQKQASELAELKKQLDAAKSSDPTLNEKVKTQLDELAMYRRRYELDKDPEVKTKFEARIEASEAKITEALKKRNAGDKLIAAIKEEGGFQKFAESGKLYPIADGEGGFQQVTGAELADQILQAIPLGERKLVEAAMIDQAQTKQNREQYFREQEQQAVKYFKEREDKATADQKNQEEEFKKAKETVDGLAKKTMEQEWLKDAIASEKATEDEKKAIAEHNKHKGQLRSLFNTALGSKSLDDMMDIITDSVRYYDERRTTMGLRAQLKRIEDQLAAKQGEIDRIKGASRTTPKSGSISTSEAKESSNEETRPTSISDAFDRIARGESLTAAGRHNDE